LLIQKDTPLLKTYQIAKNAIGIETISKTTITFFNARLKPYKMKTSELKQNYSIFGNKGTVWSNTAHIYKSGQGLLCGTPALSTNWAAIEKLEEIGCKECLAKYKDEQK
jgi:hypothetical protein